MQREKSCPRGIKQTWSVGMRTALTLMLVSAAAQLAAVEKGVYPTDHPTLAVSSCSEPKTVTATGTV